MELNKFNNRGARTRQLIVDTALRRFREQGYDRTTMRKIAAEAGLSPGNAYYYFASKSRLLVLRRTTDELIGLLQGLRP